MEKWAPGVGQFHAADLTGLRDCSSSKRLGRHGRRSTLIASQIPVEHWPEVIGEPTIADAVLDRIVHNAYRIDLKGESQRKRNRPPPLEGGNDK